MDVDGVDDDEGFSLPLPLALLLPLLTLLLTSRRVSHVDDRVSNGLCELPLLPREGQADGCLIILVVVVVAGPLAVLLLLSAMVRFLPLLLPVGSLLASPAVLFLRQPLHGVGHHSLVGVVEGAVVGAESVPAVVAFPAANGALGAPVQAG